MTAYPPEWRAEAEKFAEGFYHPDRYEQVALRQRIVEFVLAFAAVRVCKELEELLLAIDNDFDHMGDARAWAWNRVGELRSRAALLPPAPGDRR